MQYNVPGRRAMPLILFSAIGNNNLSLTGNLASTIHRARANACAEPGVWRIIIGEL